MDEIGKYFDRFGKTPLLTRADEQRLHGLIKAGDAAKCQFASDPDLSGGAKNRLHRIVAQGEVAREQFIRANLKLVVHIARKYTGGRMPLEDIVQEGTLGLIRAVEMFDAGKGFKFSTYATWWIRQRISRALENEDLITTPGGIQDERRALLRDKDDFFTQHCRQPTIKEWAEVSGKTVERINEIMINTEALSLDASHLVRDDSEVTLGDILASPVSVEDEVVAKELSPVEQAVACLSQADSEFFHLRFGDGCGGGRLGTSTTLRDIAFKLGIAPSEAITKDRRIRNQLAIALGREMPFPHSYPNGRPLLRNHPAVR